MIPDGLLRLCENIGNSSPNMFHDRRAAIRWLAGQIRELVGAANVAIRMIDLRGGVLPQEDDLPVHTAASPETTPSKCLQLEELRRLIQPVPLTSDDVFVLEDSDGPPAFDDVSLRHGQRFLICRIRLEFSLLWIQVIGDTVLFADLDVWKRLLPPALHGFMRMLDFHRRSDLRERQETFFNNLLQTDPHETTEVFASVCRIWREFSGARWAWFWLKDEYTERFELTSAATPSNVDGQKYIPPEGQRPDAKSVAAYAANTNQVVLVTDAAAWRAMLDGEEYRVLIDPSHLKELGGSSFLTVPICGGTSASGATMLNTEVRGAVCLHFSSPDDMPSIPYRALSMMGRASAQVIVNTFVKRYGEILLKMNEMARRYLTRVSRRPAEDRREYLEELIRFIQTDLHFRMMTVFWRQPFANAVECIATTGICTDQETGEVLSPDAWCEVVYKAGEGRTGRCFSEAKPFIYTSDDVGTGNEPGRSFEVDDQGVHSGEPFVLFPVPSHAEQALGVLRCVCHAEPTGSAIRRRYMRMELQPLDFIAQQLGPVLQTLETRILRERTISITKHDLYNPLNMIRDTVAQMEKDLGRGRDIGEYALSDLQASIVLATNLVKQLDPDPTEQAVFRPTPTFIEGDIVARVVGMLRRFASAWKNMHIEYGNLRAIPQLHVDRDLIERAVNNLLLNAVKYGAGGTVIRVHGRKSTAGYMLDVINDGIGIEEDEKSLIGRAHYRSPRVKSMSLGLGLGVFITRGIMEKHTGKLFITQLKDPTIFTLFFPKALAVTQH